ncbi:unnamed protein product [Clonostachys rosea]|uniref:Uncharacterized protein n=1 Tax=Bionectria ochroleuca TaxID=29856 RepID=A0ABY6UGL2_BIOOC|nr:unnamed protein product [Clonostachys rosea]
MALDLYLLPQALVHHQTRPDRPLLRALLTPTRPTILHEGMRDQPDISPCGTASSSDYMPGAAYSTKRGHGTVLYLEICLIDHA